MAERWSAADRDELRSLFSLGTRDTIVVIVPAALAFIALADPIVSLLLEYGLVEEDDVPLIARTLQGFAVGLPFFSVFQLTTRTFYAMQETRTPALVNVGAAVVTIAVDIVVVVAIGWDVPGLALGHAVSYAFATAVGLLMLRRHLGSLDGRRVARTLARAVPAATITASVALLVTIAIGTVVDAEAVVWRLLQVALAVAAGIGVYLAAGLMLGLEEVDEVMSAVRRRFRG
jgi:putative peptidoglycan lipid II flippase